MFPVEYFQEFFSFNPAECTEPHSECVYVCVCVLKTFLMFVSCLYFDTSYVLITAPCVFLSAKPVFLYQLHISSTYFELFHF